MEHHRDPDAARAPSGIRSPSPPSSGREIIALVAVILAGSTVLAMIHGLPAIAGAAGVIGAVTGLVRALRGN
jgi:hypothetical protein